jgi:2-polyprenyl-3-methyl-5-hydroxy-6-metoxy-1,4-benzoquinol methylase
LANAVAVPTSVISRACPLCGGESRNLLAESDGWPIVRCAQCSMVFLGRELNYETQISDHDWNDDFSKEKSRRQEKHPFLMFCSRLTKPLRRKDNDRLLSQTLRWSTSGQLLDFGCAAGSFLGRASKHFQVTGIEISPRFAAAAREIVGADRILEGPVTQVADERLPGGFFDIVTQFGFIEHEWQPLSALRAAFRVLKPGGITVLKTPNHASWNRHIMGLEWCGYHIPAHCNYFTPETLSAILRRAGLQPFPVSILDGLPTSDSLWMAARKPL